MPHAVCSKLQLPCSEKWAPCPASLHRILQSLDRLDQVLHRRQTRGNISRRDSSHRLTRSSTSSNSGMCSCHLGSLCNSRVHQDCSRVKLRRQHL